MKLIFDRTELVLVVGEFVDTKFELIEYTGSTPSSPDDFEPGRHNFVQKQEKIGIVVIRLKDSKCNFYILRDQVGGLRRVTMIPSGTNNQDHIFWYSEWIANTRLTQAKLRFQAWRNNMTAWVANYVEGHQGDFLDEQRASNLPASAQEFDLSPIHSIIAAIRTGIMIWDETGDETHLAQVQSNVDDALKKVDWSKHAEDTDGLMDVFRLLMNGPGFEHADAHKISNFCKVCLVNHESYGMLISIRTPGAWPPNPTSLWACTKNYVKMV